MPTPPHQTPSQIPSQTPHSAPPPAPLLHHVPEPSALEHIFFGPDGLRSGWRLLLYALIVMALVFPWWFLGHFSPHPQSPGQVNIARPTPLLPALTGEWLNVAYVLLSTWILASVGHQSVLDFGLRERQFGRRFAAGAAWGLLAMCLLVLMLLLSHHLAFSGLALRGVHAFAYAFAWAFMFLAVGIFEECLFRGYLQYALALCCARLLIFLPTNRARERTSFWTAAVLISFGFGFSHSHNPGESPIGLLAAGLAGLVLAYSLWHTGSLWWAIGFHAAWDFAQSFLFGVADSGTLIQHHLLHSHPLGAPLWSGGATGPEGSLFVLVALLLTLLVIRFTLPRTPWTQPSSHSQPSPPEQVNLPRA